MDLSMLVSSKELHPLDLTALQANNELLHFCQCLNIPTTISKDVYFKNVVPRIEQKWAAKEDLSSNLDYRRMYFWHILCLCIFDSGINRICDYGLDFHEYPDSDKMNMMKISNRRYKNLVEYCITGLKSVGLTFYTLEGFKLECSKDRNVTMQDPTPEKCNLSEAKIAQDSADSTLVRDDSIGILDDLASDNSCVDNNLPFLSDTDSTHIEPVSPDIGCQAQVQTQQHTIGIGSGNVTTCGIGIQCEVPLQPIPQIGIGIGIQCEVPQNEISIQCEVPLQPIPQIGIGIQCEVPQNEISIQCEVPLQPIPQIGIGIGIQCDLVKDCNLEFDDLIDSYIADSANHQTLTHKGKSAILHISPPFDFDETWCTYLFCHEIPIYEVWLCGNVYFRRYRK